MEDWPYDNVDFVGEAAMEDPGSAENGMDSNNMALQENDGGGFANFGIFPNDLPMCVGGGECDLAKHWRERCEQSMMERNSDLTTKNNLISVRIEIFWGWCTRTRRGVGKGLGQRKLRGNG